MQYPINSMDGPGGWISRHALIHFAVLDAKQKIERDIRHCESITIFYRGLFHVRDVPECTLLKYASSEWGEIGIPRIRHGDLFHERFHELLECSESYHFVARLTIALHHNTHELHVALLGIAVWVHGTRQQSKAKLGTEYLRHPAWERRSS